MVRSLPLLFLLLLTFYTKAQQNSQYLFRHIDEQNGLLHNTVYSIVQDKNGFMWLATVNGIQRFDGVRFVNYENNLKAFSYSPAIRNIYADDKNNIWIAGSELACINTITGKTLVYNETQILSNPQFKFTTYTDHRNRKWLLGDFALYATDSVTGKMTAFSIFTPHQTSQLGNIVFTDSIRNCTWVTDHDDFMLFDEKTKQVYTADYNPLNNPVLKAFAKKSISFLSIDEQHTIWAAEWNSVIDKYDDRLKASREYFPLHTDEKKPRATNKDTTATTLCMYHDAQGSMWLSNDRSGLFRYNQASDHFEMIWGKNNEQKGLGYNNILSIIEDRDGDLWLGSDKGISIFNPYRQYFYSITHHDDFSSLPQPEITSFLQATDGTFYIGTWGGGFSIYDSSLKFKKTISPKGNFELSLIWCFAQNDDGKIWIGTQHGYLHIYDPATGKLETIHPHEMENKTIRCIKKDGEGNLWFGLHNGKIVKWDKQAQLFLSQPENGFTNRSPVRAIFIDNQHRFWISADDKLLQFDPVSLQYLGSYAPSLAISSTEASNGMHGIEQENDSILFIGTMRYGLYLFNTNSKQFTQHPNFAQLPAINIYALKKDTKNNLWMSSDYCLYELNKKSGKLIKHDLSSGLINSAFEMFELYPLQNGNWLTCTRTDAITFNPVAISSDDVLNKKVTLTGIRVFDKELLLDSLVHNNEPLKLNYDQNFIMIEVTTHSYFGPAQNIYYKLSGIDQNWVKGNEKAGASYTNLAPGKYIFRLKASDENADATITSFSIIISPPFYRTWWFQLTVVLLTGFTVYFLMKKRIENIKQKADLRHKISETEMMALRSQMNPHFIFNCLSAIDNLIQTNQPDKATTYLARFARLIRSVLESTKNNLVPFHKDFESLRLYIELEQFSSGDKFCYQLIADDDLLNGDYKVPPLIVQPFAENAIHHGLMNKLKGSRTLSIKASLRNNFICYTVTDNGVGRKKAMEIKDHNRADQPSYGLEITKERIQLHNRQYSAGNSLRHRSPVSIDFKDLVEYNQPVGTEVCVHIKCNS